MKRSIVVILAGLLFWGGCISETENEREDQSNHEKMVEVLDSIATHSDPRKNYHMNLAMAEIHLSEIENTTDPQARVKLFVAYCQELLNGGKTARAIENLENMKNQLIDQGGGLSKFTKLIYDLLAIAYLRLGEKQNCVENHTSASCIIPLKEVGRHQLVNGSENAIRMYEEILSKFPGDMNSVYLLNIAYMTLGQYPEGVPDEWVLPLESQPEIDFPYFDEIAIGLGLDVLGLSGGVCVEDFNNNGYHDIFVTSYGLMDQCRLFLNNGDGSFTDATVSAGLEGIVSGLNAVHADYNNDGYVDILILRGAWLGEGGTHPNSLLRNNGDGTFTDVTKEAGLLSFHPTQTASWADFDGDGYLDLYIGNESQVDAGIIHPNELYRNNGDGTFTDIAPRLGLDITVFSKGVVWSDINNSGLPDLYISDLGGPNRLYMNRGGTDLSNWHFEDIAQSAGVQFSIYSFPAGFMDFDNDGYQDLLVLDYNLNRIDRVAEDYALEILGEKPPSGTMKLYRNLGNEKFEDVTEKYGLDKVTYTMGFNYGDLNNNGYLDFYLGTGAPDFRTIVPNRMFLNRGGDEFTEVTPFGFGHIQKGHGIAFADMDNDGDQDIYAVQGGAFEGDVAFNLLFENPLENSNWVHLELEGTRSNRSAIGAKIEVVTMNGSGEEKTFHRVVNSGGTFGASPLRQEIGLGHATEILKIEVHWPSGEESVSVYEHPPINSILELEEDNPNVEVIDHPPIKLNQPLQEEHPTHSPTHHH